MNLPSTSTLIQSGPGSNSNEGLFHIPQTPKLEPRHKQFNDIHMTRGAEERYRGKEVKRRIKIEKIENEKSQKGEKRRKKRMKWKTGKKDERKSEEKKEKRKKKERKKDIEGKK